VMVYGVCTMSYRYKYEYFFNFVSEKQLHVSLWSL
jgi:hypothetical protein